MKFECTYCGGHESKLIDGWYFCNECNRQSYQAFEFDVYDAAPNVMVRKTKIKDKPTASENEKTLKNDELTTWEGFNYILLGLTEQLISLGVTPAIKLTVFQLWAEYLRKTEIAFFDKRKPALPKLPPLVNNRDADLLYNHKRRDRKTRYKRASSSAAAGSMITNKAKKRRLTKLIDDSQRSEHDSILKSNKSDINQTLSSLSDMTASDVESLSASGAASGVSSISIEFSRVGRASLKKSMPKKHIKVHADDFEGTVKCHRMTYARQSFTVKKYILNRNLLFTILYCALHHHGEPVQIADLIRFGRENYLSYNGAEHFLPANINSKNVQHINSSYSGLFKSTALSRSLLELRIPHIKDFLEVHLQPPNLYDLCSRYVEELCLPHQLNECIERIISNCVPKLTSGADKIGKRETMYPCFEGRAMAYILFALKLIFGLNDVTEITMSESAKSINSLLQDVDKTKNQLFVWTEWVEYIEAREVLLNKYHNASYFHDTATNDKTSSAHFVNHVKASFASKIEHEEGHEIHNTGPTKIKPRRREELLDMAKSLCNEHEPLKEFFIEFPPSFTPNKACMEIIRDQYADKVHIPSLLHKDHANRDIDLYLDSLPLYEYLLQNRIRLELMEAELNPSTKFVRWSSNDQPKNTYTFSKVNLNIDPLKWEESVKQNEKKDMDWIETDTKNVHERRKAKFERLQKKRRNKRVSVKLEEQDNTEFEQTESLSSVLDPLKENILPIPKESDYSSSICLKTPHFQYWTYFIYSFNLWSTYTFHGFEEILDELPKSFVWLLEKCCKIIESNKLQLYRELLTIESHFLYSLKPMDQTTNTLVYRKNKELPKLMRIKINRFAKRF